MKLSLSNPHARPDHLSRHGARSRRAVDHVAGLSELVKVKTAYIAAATEGYVCQLCPILGACDGACVRR